MKDLFVAFYSYEDLSEFITADWRFLGIGAGFKDAVKMLHTELRCTEEIKLKPQGGNPLLWFGSSMVSALDDKKGKQVFVRIYCTQKRFYPDTFRNRILHYLRG